MCLLIIVLLIPCQIELNFIQKLYIELYTIGKNINNKTIYKEYDNISLQFYLKLLIHIYLCKIKKSTLRKATRASFPKKLMGQVLLKKIIIH